MMWRNEAGLMEMLFTYIGEFNEFESYANWRPVLVDILASHEEIRKQRIAYANEYVSEGTSLKDEDDIEMEMKQTVNSQESETPSATWFGDDERATQSNFSIPRDVGGDVKVVRPPAMWDFKKNNTAAPIERNIKEEYEDPALLETPNTFEDGTPSFSSELQTSMIEPNVAGGVRNDFSDSSRTGGDSEDTVNAGIDLDNERPFQCVVCLKGFKRNTHLRRHMLIHSGERSYPCEICGLSFFESGHLKRHILTHSGWKPFACTICGKSFTRNEHVRTHMRLHEGDRPYTCNICGKSYIRLTHLRTHMLLHDQMNT